MIPEVLVNLAMKNLRRVTRLKISTREGIKIKTKEIFRPRDIKEIRRIKGV
jgi:hypothetical protein